MQKSELLKLYEKQEEILRFKHFSNEDALSLGLLFIEYAKSKSLSIAIDITVNGYQIFRYGFEGTRSFNDKWLKRKINTVNTLNKSSLHVGQILADNNKDLVSDWHLDPNEYTSIGGGFPIYLEGTGVIGSVCVSGLPHEEDHEVIINVLKDYLKVDF